MARSHCLSGIANCFAVQPVVALLGPRQCGKTTLARMYAERLRDDSAGTGVVTRFDPEAPTDLAALAEPKLALQGLSGLVIIDEIQRAPEIFPVLRVLVDRPGNPARLLDDTGPLPRPDAQPVRAGTVLRGGRRHGARLPGHPRGHRHGPPAAALVRKRSMRAAMETPGLDRLTILYPGDRWLIFEDITALGIAELTASGSHGD